MSHVISAPIPFLIALSLGLLVIVYVVSQHYEGRYRDRIETRDAQIEFLKTKLEASKTPDAANAVPVKTQSGRTLTQKQISSMRAALDLSAFEQAVALDIVVEAGCAECASYQNELGYAFSGIPGLSVSKSGVVMGPADTHPSGLVVMGLGFNDPNSFASKVSLSLSAAGVEHGRVNKDPGFGPPGVTGPGAMIVVLSPRKYRHYYANSPYLVIGVKRQKLGAFAV